jgi:uncharacterized protein YcgI (DUF1989 family)
VSLVDRRVEIPAREGAALRAGAGQRLRVIDLDGGQVADVFAFVAHDVSEYHSAEHTRVHVGSLFPKPGEQFVTNRRRPILTFEEDRSPGAHDMLCAACDASRYASLGVGGWHASCQENLLQAMARLGHDRVAVPQPINFFMNTPVRQDGSIAWLPTPTLPGDHVVLRAELDIVLVVSSCPQDIVGINGGNPTRIGIELL